MPKQVKTTAEKSGIASVASVCATIQKALEPEPVAKKPRAKVVLSPEDAQKRKAILTERLVKARAVKAEKAKERNVSK